MTHWLHDEERSLAAAEVANARALAQDPKGLPLRKPAMQTNTPTPLAPAPGVEQFIRTVEQACEDCGGSGRNEGSPDPWDTSDCSKCGGSGSEIVSRNYLAEALAIAQNPESARVIEREHLVVIIQYARQFVSTAMSLPAVSLGKVA